MSMTRKAWWGRARWFVFLYSLVFLMGALATPVDEAINGWRIAMVFFSSLALIGMLGSLRVVIGLKRGHMPLAVCEFAGVAGIVIFEALHAAYVLTMSFVGGPWMIGRAIAHAIIALSVAIAYRSRPVRDRRVA